MSMVTDDLPIPYSSSECQKVNRRYQSLRTEVKLLLNDSIFLRRFSARYRDSVTIALFDFYCTVLSYLIIIIIIIHNL